MKKRSCCATPSAAGGSKRYLGMLQPDLLYGVSRWETAERAAAQLADKYRRAAGVKKCGRK